MATLNATKARRWLAREIAAGNVEYDPDTRRFVAFEAGQVAGVVTAAFNDLRRAGLARLIGATRTELTDAGIVWLEASGG